MMIEKDELVRIDIWLWAARFFKTRSLATKAVNGGKVHLNGTRVKPSKAIKAGDRLLIHKGTLEFYIEVLGVNSVRRPAKEAQQLYAETEESRQKREESREMRKMANAGHTFPPSKPNKRDRRKIKAFIRKNQGE